MCIHYTSSMWCVMWTAGLLLLLPSLACHAGLCAWYYEPKSLFCIWYLITAMRKGTNTPPHHDFLKREYFITQRACSPKRRYLCVLIGVYCELDKSPGTQWSMICIRLVPTWEYWSTLIFGEGRRGGKKKHLLSPPSPPPPPSTIVPQHEKAETAQEDLWWSPPPLHLVGDCLN